MKNKCYSFLVILIVCLSCNVAKKASFNPTQKYSPAQLKEDFSLLKNILKSNHPSLYWYATSDSVDEYFSSTLTALQDSLTEQQFKNRVSWVIDKIHCGHTTVRSSQKSSKYYRKQRLPQFPLSLKVWNDSAIVISNLLSADTVINRGTIITAINQVTIKQIIDSMCQLIGTDGYSNNFKYQAISFNFPAYYTNAFGIDSQYLIKYIDSSGHKKEKILKNYEAKGDTGYNKTEMVFRGLPKKQFKELRIKNDRNITIDTSINTAFMSVNTFSEGKLIRFFNKSFKRIKKDRINNVVIDLRLNSGGNVLSCARLSQYLIDKPFHVADTVAAFSRHFVYKEHIKPWFIYWLSMHVSGRRYNDGRIHFRYFENHYFKPKKKNHFDGNVYLVTGGYTFSAATLVASNLKGQKNVTIVGEETGGGAYGNSAMFLTTIVLPNTGVRVTLPLYRMVLNADRPKNGRGIFPDVEVKPSSVYIRMGEDAKLEKVKELIKQQTTGNLSMKRNSHN